MRVRDALVCAVMVALVLHVVPAAARNILHEIDLGWKMGDLAFSVCKELTNGQNLGWCDEISIAMEEAVDLQDNATIHMVYAMKLDPNNVFPKVLNEYLMFTRKMIRQAIELIRDEGLSVGGVKNDTARLQKHLRNTWWNYCIDICFKTMNPGGSSGSMSGLFGGSGGSGGLDAADLPPEIQRQMAEQRRKDALNSAEKDAATQEAAEVRPPLASPADVEAVR